MIHALKIKPCYFHPVAMKKKRFEIRDNRDRDFQAGDRLIINEFDGKETGRYVEATITYVTNYSQKENYVVLSIDVDFIGDKNNEL